MSRVKMPVSRSFSLWPFRLGGFRGLHRPEVMITFIDRERNRADRSGGCFSLVVFEAGSNVERRRLGRMISQRARATDEIGYLRDDSIGALLPDTGMSGAKCFVEHVAESADDPTLAQTCQIFVYPENWNDERDGHGRRGPNLRLVEKAGEAAAETAPAMDGLSAKACCLGVPSALETMLALPLPWWKRALDLLAGSVAIVLLSPVMAGAALAVKWSGPGPVLFKQQRSGLGGRVFTIYKFRTMIVNAEQKKTDLMHLNEQDGPAFKIKNDPRVTGIGRFLRHSSLDELPQLFNVLKGDMTLVGPRPLPVAEAEKCRQWQRRRLSVTPGLTCIWQVKGRSKVSFDQWVRMDMQYIQRRAITTDLKLLAFTVPAVVLRRGAH